MPMEERGGSDNHGRSAPRQLRQMVGWLALTPLHVQGQPPNAPSWSFCLFPHELLVSDVPYTCQPASTCASIVIHPGDRLVANQGMLGLRLDEIRQDANVSQQSSFGFTCSPDSFVPGSTPVTERKTDQHYGGGGSLHRPSPQRSPFRGVRPGILLAQISASDDAMLNSLFWIGANYHRPVDLPDTTGLSWREGILRCLESVRPQSRTSPPTSAQRSSLPASALRSCPQAANMASGIFIIDMELPLEFDAPILSLISAGPIQHP
ncbi:hypothetical protein Q8A67_019330 [Cirrhinus molitorella]|uniref:Uncharacterized protein n=1 Tax=Cirrhinus molitorella TaxID=172907 RepID=A0AA88PDU1_9TELE|nr:hypothetical protein Q8A67_019330 [Cirrhinus molitorella]